MLSLSALRGTHYSEVWTHKYTSEKNKHIDVKELKKLVLNRNVCILGKSIMEVLLNIDF